MSDLTLAEFLAARLGEDEAVARRNTGDSGLADDGETGPAWPDYATYTGTDDYDAAYDYITRFRPVRMLREVESGRKILAEHHATDWRAYGDLMCFRCRLDDDEPIPDGHHWVPWPCPTVRALAAVYSDHPDYREEWRP